MLAFYCRGHRGATRRAAYRLVRLAGRYGARRAQRPPRLTRILERANLRQIRIDDLRHTFASLLIQNGESLAYVRDQLGLGTYMSPAIWLE